MIKRILKWTVRFFLLLCLVGFLTLFVAYWGSTNDCGRSAVALVQPMKAIVYCDYGPPDVLHLEEIERPVPNDDQVLIKVRAASINPYDWHFMRGTPYVLRLGAGLRKPKSVRLGGDVAGEIAAVGKNVTQFKPGDAVFGLCSGSLGEYCLAKSKIVAKPEGVSFEQAAALPVAAVTALEGLRDTGKLKPGESVLVNGASGGVGTFAIQIAKSLGGQVTGVCSGRSGEMVRGLGADRVIDYTKEDFTQDAARYDLIVDCVGTQPLSGMRRALKPDGRCILIGGGGPDEGHWFGPMLRPIKAMMISPFVSQKLSMLMADVSKNELVFLGDMVATGKLKPVIDRTYKLSETPEAMRYLEQGHAHGKVIITFD